MLSKRKALIGYLAYVTGKPILKRVMKRKAKAVVPGTRPGSRIPNVPAIVAAAGAVLGGLFFWRRRKGRGGEASES